MVSKLRSAKLVTAKNVKKLFSGFHQVGSHVVPGSKKIYDMGFPVRFVQNYKVPHRLAEVHLHEDDVFFCMYGGVQFILGGQLVDPWTKDKLNFFADSVKNGRKIILKAGDWLHVPAGQPHQHFTTHLCRLVVVKVVPSEGKVRPDYLKHVRKI